MFEPKQALEWLLAKQKLCLQMQLPLTELVAELYEYVDQFSEQDLTGLSDYMALYAELLDSLQEQQDISQQTVPINACREHFQQAFNAEIEPAVVGLIALLQHPAWPQPVPAEDAEFLQELLQGELAQLFADVAVEKPSQPSPEAQPHPAIAANFAELPELLSNIATQLPNFTDDLSAAFYQLIDDYSEADWTGIADLMALLGELLAQLGEMQDSTIAQQLLQAWQMFLQEPAEASAERILQSMQNESWPEPVPAEDIEFLQPLLREEIVRLLGAEQPIAEAEPQQSLADTVLPEPPAFCAIDFSLLEEDGPQIDPAVMAMLSQSLQDLQEQWQANSEGLLESTSERLQVISRALATVNLLGAKLLVEGLDSNIQYLHENNLPLLEDKRESVVACIDGLLAYCNEISLYENQQTLLDQFIDTQLPSKPTTEQASFLMGLLALASLQSSDDIEQEQATEADIALQESDEIDPQLLDMLHNELPTLSEAFLDHLQAMSDGSDGGALPGAQRAVHTLKGLANMAGIRGLANMAHRVEDILDYLSDAALAPSQQLSADLLEAADCMAAMAETVTTASPAPDNALSVLQQVMDWDYRLKTAGAEALQQAADQGGTVPAENMTTAVDQASANAEPAEPPREEAEAPAFRVQRGILDDLFRLAGESSTLNTQLEEELTQLRGATRMNRERHRNLQRVMFELEQQFSEQMNLQPQLDESSEAFDPLEMDRYNELHTTISRVQEAAADVRELTQDMERHIQSLGTLHIAQSGLQKETLDRVLSTRLVEAKTLTTRLQRILRQACRSTGKQAQLLIQGEDTLVDSHILNQLADPLLHMIRNAVDHGLESPRLRQQRNKPEQGTVTLSFALRNDQIEVTCEDDGDGINTPRVLAVAAEKKLIQAGVELSDEEIHRLILLPGFSTRDEVNQLSGRGIGMDVVYQQILRLQGTLDISSSSRQGTRLRLSMPANSLMVRTLLVRCGQQVFALSGHGVEQSLLSLDGRLQQQDEQLQFSIGGETYPAFMLESLLEQRGFNYLEADTVFPVLIVNLANGERVALLVREVLAHRELAFKQMSDYLPEIPGIPGMTILANGEAAPIVDLPARIRFKRARLIEQPQQFDFSPEVELPRLLVVDDSLSARKSLQTLLSDTGYEVMTAIDGLDALNQIRKRTPDLILTDMEMPRMGGVELCSVLKNREETGQIPVLMITSRSTGKHRAEAEEAGVATYITKPWTENQLLDEVEALLAQAIV